MSRIPGDVIVLPEPAGRWRLHNVFTRTSLVLDVSGLRLARAVEADSPNLDASLAAATFPVWEVQCFSNENGLMADPSNFLRDPQQWGEPELLDAEELLRRLRRRWLLVDDEAGYRARFAPRRDVLDHEHFPNFHQELGTHLMLKLRRDPEAWWIDQKFTQDMRDVRENLYGAIQHSFLKRYFAERLSPGQEVVDVGCGPGFYTNLMARTGAKVLGVDPSISFIEVARRHAEPAARFELLKVSEAGAMDEIPTASADVVFMSDALLFYFVPATSEQVADLDVLLGDIHRILKPEGRFISMEPHYIFWLRPWLGDVDRPFTVLSEYLHKTFGVTPSISELIRAYASGGFAVLDMRELTPDPAFESLDARAYRFASQFPLWQLFELMRLP
ncbi:MAG TPA: methyltransferase domain-containing protein [Solirubrobacteraceae bacterium]|nr:methyltransferase domain-containing protein [Solirubrobacteraceae bacterium]